MSESELSDQSGLSSSDVVSTNTAFNGKIWNVVSKSFNFYGEKLTREYIEHPGAVAVFAINQADEVLVIRQYRAPVNEFLLEIPAGLKDKSGESSVETAKRELAEEADYSAQSWSELQTFYTTPGSSSEKIEIFLAKDLTKLSTSFERTAEERHMSVNWVSFRKLLEAVQSSKVKSPTLVLAVLAYASRAKE